MAESDFRKLYHLEQYLFEEVSRRFAQRGQLDAFDFFCIIIWKANRAKSRIAKRLLAQGFEDLEPAVTSLTVSLANASDNKERMRSLIDDWGFRLPMASAILTVLYPDAFTVYDVRVYEALGDFHNIQHRTDFNAMWDEYQSYIAAVMKKGFGEYNLRDKDRWLWGKSFCEQLKDDISSQFSKTREENDIEK